MTTLHTKSRATPPSPQARAARRMTGLAKGLLLVWILQAPWSGAMAQNTPATSAPDGSALPVQNSPLTATLFYQLLLGELNLIGDEPGAAYSLILDAARKQRSTQLYRRAVEVALQARSGDAALTAARTWAQDLPGQGCQPFCPSDPAGTQPGRRNHSRDSCHSGTQQQRRAQ